LLIKPQRDPQDFGETAELSEKQEFTTHTEQPVRTNEERTQAGYDAIYRAEIWRTLTAPIQDDQLVFHKQRFCHHGTTTASAHQIRDGGQQVNE
jgi:hypothetical protein